ncbi:MAG TPA: hypothetical protein VMY78_11870 [Solirubrobacteraceae bacterium]|nr:hypothetical protein [Solirubrobacteraceae bacterium]
MIVDRFRGLLDLARALNAVPHLITEQAEHELRVDELEQRLNDVAAIANEFTSEPWPERSRTPASGGGA